MAAVILSQDILAICLFLADGNINLSLGEVIRRVENYQEVQNRHFGISRSDFRGLFQMLISWELGIKSFGDELDDIKLSYIITEILKYHDGYFNDEGEHWTKDYNGQHEEIDYRLIEYRFGYNKEEYQEKLKLKEEMERFFGQQPNGAIHPKLVRKFMKEIKITDSILSHCARPGSSS